MPPEMLPEVRDPPGAQPLELPLDCGVVLLPESDLGGFENLAVALLGLHGPTIVRPDVLAPVRLLLES